MAWQQRITWRNTKASTESQSSKNIGLALGNSGRNTAVIRSNYLRNTSIRFFEQSLKLYEQLGRDLNYNIMFSQRSEVDVSSNERQH